MGPLSFQEQDIIEQLILSGPVFVPDLADEMQRPSRAVETDMLRLERAGLVRRAFSRSPGPAYGDPLGWEFCGGSPSWFFNYALNQGRVDGLRAA